MEINVNSSEIRSYVTSITISNEGVSYDGDVELYRYNGGFDEDDMEILRFEDENGNELDESLIDRSEIFRACLNSI